MTWLSLLVLTEPCDCAVPSPQSIVADVLSILPTTSENDWPSTGSHELVCADVAAGALRPGDVALVGA